MTIDIVPTASVGEDNGDTIGDAFGTGWDVFVAVLYRTGFVLAVLAPFLIVGALLALLVRFVPAPPQGQARNRTPNTPRGRTD